MLKSLESTAVSRGWKKRCIIVAKCLGERKYTETTLLIEKVATMPRNQNLAARIAVVSPYQCA
jgi:hypothetical protein